MIAAAKLANENNDKLKADQLCYQAMSYSDSNTIKALFQYADFLEEIKREDSLAVRTKAHRLKDLKEKQTKLTKPKTAYLGFVPWQMLNSYANLLEKKVSTAEAESMKALGSAYQYTQEVHAVRMKIILEDGGSYGLCVGFDRWKHKGVKKQLLYFARSRMRSIFKLTGTSAGQRLKLSPIKTPSRVFFSPRRNITMPDYML